MKRTILIFSLLSIVFALPINSFAIVSDDFNVCALDTGTWTFVDPVGNAGLSISGAGSGDARLEISVPAGSNHDPWSVNEASRLMQPAMDADFEVEVKFDSSVTQRYQDQGIIVEESGNNWLRFDIYSDGSHTKLFAASMVNGTASTKTNATIATGSPVYLKVTRTGDVWDFRYSFDGSNWTLGTSFSHAMTVSSVGPYAGNLGSGGSAPAHTAIVDYFFNTASPIASEDGAALPSDAVLSVAQSGLGSVSIDPDQATYTCGQVVTLTAVPDAGYQFTGWSGDLSGTDNPAVVVMNGNQSVSATFELDTNPPVISDVQIAPSQDTAVITWQTDEPSTSVVDYGNTIGYEIGTEQDLTLTTSHSIVITGLFADTLYHIMITSEDTEGRAASTSDLTFTTVPNADGPVIDVWYGSNQRFGHIGIPQTWVNILGNVSDSDGVDSLTYSLNGGPNQALSLGPDSRRLVSDGDFNVELDHSILIDGNNTLVLTATDIYGNISTNTVIISYTAGNSWPENYSIDWSSVTDIQDVAQVVDGIWNVGKSGGVSPDILGYDRLITVGDINWQNYEVTVPITVNSIDPSGYSSPSNGPAVGMGMRWNGHSKWDDSQPNWGFWPTGAFGWYRWKTTYERFQLAGNEYAQIDEDLSGRTLSIGTTYVFKMRVETLTNGNPLYSFKVWEQGDPEPTSWDLSIEEGPGDPTHGSILLLAHHVEAVFGNVEITSIP